MKLSLILEQARSSELSSLSPKDKTDAKIVTYVNAALVEMYRKFQLATEEAIIRLRPDLVKTVYTLGSTDSDVIVAGKPMTDGDVMVVLEAFNEDGSPITINDENDPYSIYTVTYNQLQIPLLGNHTYVSVIYKKNPPLVTYKDDGNGNAQDCDVPVPLQLLSAMCHYIGYRAHSAVDGNVQAENSTHYAKYMAAIAELVAEGSMNAESTVHATFKKRGFA